MFWTRLWITARWLSPTLSVAAAATGFHGTVTIGPLQPVCSVSVPCDGPAKHVTLTFSNPQRVRRVITTDAGTYRILLPSGIYTVRANRGMWIRPARVWVHRGVVGKLNFAIDTGIR